MLTAATKLGLYEVVAPLGAGDRIEHETLDTRRKSRASSTARGFSLATFGPPMDEALAAVT